MQDPQLFYSHYQQFAAPCDFVLEELNRETKATYQSIKAPRIVYGSQQTLAIEITH